MKNRINTTSLTYQGRVDVSFMINGKEVRYKGHNEGLNAMFKAIAKVLSGDMSTVVDDIPAYVDIRCEWSDGDGAYSETVLYNSNQLSISNPEYRFTVENGWITEYQVVLSYNMINFDYMKLSVPDSADTYLYLVTNKGEDFARLKLSPDDIKLTDIVPGTQGIIQWTLIFENKK